MQVYCFLWITKRFANLKIKISGFFLALFPNPKKWEVSCIIIFMLTLLFYLICQSIVW